MPRKRKPVGLTLDLTRWEEGTPFVFEDLIVKEEEVIHKKQPLTHCQICNVLYHCSRNVGDLSVCFFCYRLSTATEEVATFLRTAYSKPCEFCGTTDAIKHFDHKNMFDKRYCIIEMTQMSIDDIQKEIDLCQILCKECHYKVTRAEAKAGFIKKKFHINKKKKKGIDVSAELEILREEYAKVMVSVYETLRKKLTLDSNDANQINYSELSHV